MNASSCDLLVVGAGPHAFTLCCALESRRRHPTTRLRVLDPSGRWMDRWRHAFGALDITNLRSPSVHHPDPDPHGFESWLRDEARPGSGLPHGLPDTTAFEDFCGTLEERHGLAGVVEPHAARLLCTEEPDTNHVLLDDGRLLTARRVVLATNAHRRVVPAWARPHIDRSDRVRHSAQIDLRHRALAGEHVVVVGGGLTAAHLVCGAVRRGARVTLLARRGLRTRHFDVDPGWLGPKHLGRFSATEDWPARRRMIDHARDGGTVPPWMHRQLASLADSGWLEISSPARVESITVGDLVAVRLEGGTCVVADRVWLATGTRASVDAEPLLDDIARDHPTTIVDGLPVLTDDLRWPGTGIHLTGRLAGLLLGPAAGNLWGARQATQRIAPSLGVLADPVGS